MLFNHLLHIIVGILVPDMFRWSVGGVLAAAFISVGVQAVDVIRIRRQAIAMSMANPEPTRSQQLEAIRGSVGTYKLVQLFVYKTIWYALVTLAAAHITRAWFG